MSSQNVAYLRVSSVDQSVARQQEAIKVVSLDKTFIEKASGKDTNRPVLQECLEYCREGDTLHVHSIDRIARNLKDLQGLVDQLIAKDVTVHFHKEGLIFNGNDDAMSRLMLQMMGAFAEFERALINERQREGIAAARKAGKQFGRRKNATMVFRQRLRKISPPFLATIAVPTRINRPASGFTTVNSYFLGLDGKGWIGFRTYDTQAVWAIDRTLEREGVQE
jgi:DNA invertase Pin-like site-specific DNA recombinase